VSKEWKTYELGTGYSKIFTRVFCIRVKIKAVGLNNIFALYFYITHSVTEEFIISAEQVEIR
jgi:hypothetical protein